MYKCEKTFQLVFICEKLNYKRGYIYIYRYIYICKVSYIIYIICKYPSIFIYDFTIPII